MTYSLPSSICFLTKKNFILLKYKSNVLLENFADLDFLQIRVCLTNYFFGNEKDYIGFGVGNGGYAWNK